MSSMSYCRFGNTQKDLKDCVNAIQADDTFKDLSKTEQAAYCNIKALCEEFLNSADDFEVN
ncbi:MAG: hypothetical protein GY756_09820 [bacterium]|nr:hypothetical protein [bacterium]